MDRDLSDLHQNESVSSALRVARGRQLERAIGHPGSDPMGGAVALLRVAAIASFGEMVGQHGVEVWFRPRGPETRRILEQAKDCYWRWQGYLDALLEASQAPSLDDLLMFAVAGLIADRDHEVRDALRRPSGRTWVANLEEDLASLPWIGSVRASIGASLLHVVRQEDHDDVRQGNAILRGLAEKQKTIEEDWLRYRHASHRDAATLLGMYHLAEAVLLTVRFLAEGSVEVDGRESNDYEAELRRLLVRSAEFLEFGRDGEAELWLRTVAAGLAHIRSSSIWVQGRGISSRIDRLLDELTSANRDRPVFSLLPSQERALRDSFMDAGVVAMVLQMPTSAGKTLLAEFKIAQVMDAFQGSARVAFVVPTRALATQTRRTLARDLGPLGIRVAATGSAFEDDPYEVGLLESSDGVVVATPEKLDLLLRNHSDWFRTLRLVIVDEAHLIEDGERGARLELLLANLRREHPDARLLLMTPFMENAPQIAEWLSRERPLAISVDWRPAQVLLGMASVRGRGSDRVLRVEWTDPYRPGLTPEPLLVPDPTPGSELSSNTARILHLAKKLAPLGTTLAMFSASPAEAEKAARQRAELTSPIPLEEMSPHLRLATSLARHEFGHNSSLAFCLERGVAYHHSSLPSVLRYLIESRVQDREISFIAATSTLAQGMNFPVSTILIHSVHKPYGQGDFTPSEFWNLAGRAGRVGLADNGLVLFTNPSHQEHLDRYSEALSTSLVSAIMTVLDNLDPDGDLKEQYRAFAPIRPFIQYLAHAAAKSSARDALRNLEALIGQSLVNQQVTSEAMSRKLRALARSYLQQLIPTSPQMVRLADSSGLGTFSFSQLYATLRNDPILSQGPGAVVGSGLEGYRALVEALRWLPELDLAIGYGSGPMSVEAVARTVQAWVAGEPIHRIATTFPGGSEDKRVRDAARYLNGTISQTLSWGAHAFMRGFVATGGRNVDAPPSDEILPSMIQYGVRTPEAVVASFLGVPRSFAEAVGHEYRSRFGAVTPDTAPELREFLETADVEVWEHVVRRSGVTQVSGADVREVLNEMHGYPG